MDFTKLQNLKPGETLRLSGFSNASRAFFACQFVLKTEKPLVVFVDSLKEANTWVNDCDFFLQKKIPVYLFLSLDVLPYYSLSPNPDVIMNRLGLLSKISHQKNPFILIVPIKALSRRLMPFNLFEQNSFTLLVDENIELNKLTHQLITLGYQRTPIVEDEGCFAVRGGIVDVFTPNSLNPVRLDFFGDTIEKIREFDILKQTTIKSVDSVCIIPAREVLTHLLPKGWKDKLKKRCDDLEISKLERDECQNYMENHIYFNGIESFLPFFFEKTSTLFDYLPNTATLIFNDHHQLHLKIEEFILELKTEKKKSTSLERIIQPQELFSTSSELQEFENYFPLLNFSEIGKPDDYVLTASFETNENLKTQIQAMIHTEKALAPMVDEINKRRLNTHNIFIVASTLAQKERLKDLLKNYEVPLKDLDEEKSVKEIIFDSLLNNSHSPFIQLLTGTLSEGFFDEKNKQWWITDQEIFGKKSKRSLTKSDADAFSSFSELTEGDYVVHDTHGVGLYRGLTMMELLGKKNEFILLEYLGGDKLYVPVDQLGKIFRYQAQTGSAPLLDKMGGATWKKVRDKVKKATRKLASELLKLQALRQTATGFQFSSRNTLFEEFEATFQYEETDDQLSAIDDVLNDMESDKPMDRLVCGDVGYGKTEVAIRAAFKAVIDNKQVAILVPTTVLAFQHFETFKNRLQKYPVNIELLSRFQSATDQKKIVDKLKNREVDIIIATHRLLSNDIRFSDLGLLVIDEEHRFGVKQKEKIKRFKKTVDVLTLTATPIPRTLNFALTGIRDLSLITTPPADRLSIRTYVTHFEEGTLIEAIHREIKRGGQVYFVHNRVQTINGMKDRLAKMMPTIKIKIAHGQMEEHQLEDVMLDFMHHKFDVLLCTTIIESGLDIANANTIIINRADNFGLAQLYQLRGRVGRSHHRAYCYLLTPTDVSITKVAEKRLSVIRRFTELGSGFKIASHDLEIRGAGNILGAEQSGHIAAIGYEMYVKLLEEAIFILKGEDLDDAIECEIKLPVSANIPEHFIPDASLRLVLYKKLASARVDEDCLHLKEEWTDRFGELPYETENLIQMMRVRLMAQKLKIKKISANQGIYNYEITSNTPVNPTYFMEKVKTSPNKYKILPDGRFIIREKENNPSELEMIQTIRKHLLEMI